MADVITPDTGAADDERRRAGAVAALLLLSAAAAAMPSASSEGPGQTRVDASVTVDAASAAGPVSPLLHGQFLEFMFEGIKSGLTAELVRDRGFEAAPNAIGLPRDFNRYPDDRNDDYGLRFHWDDQVAYPVASDYLEPPPTQHALRVDARLGVVERRGIYQSRFPIRADVPYQGYLWLKTSGYAGTVTVALEADVTGGEVYAEAETGEVSGDWRRYAFELRPKRSDPLARFAVLFPGTGRVWIDQISLMPGDAINGVRADVLERIRGVQPSFLRWPGGNVAQDYHWIWGVGPRDRRPIWPNLSWNNEPEPGDFGTDEYVALSRAVGAEPTITVNVEGRGATPAEAAAWVEYCNGPPTSRYGAMRAANGHPEPFGVKYWEIGNEIWGDWVRGHSDAATYARNYQRYYDAMRAVDPTIRFIAVGDNDMSWNRTVLRAVGRSIDFLAIHHYYGRKPMAGDLRNLMARPLYYERFYREMAQLVAAEVPGRAIQLAINEWGLDLPESLQHSMHAALYGARLMNVFERSSPLVGMSAVSDLVNGWPGGIIQASRHGVFVTPLYHVHQMYTRHRGAERLRTEVDGPVFDSTSEGVGVAAIDAVASRSLDKRTIILRLVNTDLARDLDVEIRVRGARIAARAERHLLTAASLATRTSFSAPDAIRPVVETIDAGDVFSLRVPKHSVSVVALAAAAQ